LRFSFHELRLLIVTSRPEFEPPWIGEPHVAALTIDRQPTREVEAVGHHAPPGPVLLAQRLVTIPQKALNEPPL
jgi:hypothetical protein